MDKEVLIAIITALTSAGVFSFIQYLISRRDKKKQQDSTEREALRYLMFYIIQDMGAKYIAHESITLEQKQMLHKWHKLYHEGLGGNGDANLLMELIDELPVKMQEGGL